MGRKATEAKKDGIGPRIRLRSLLGMITGETNTIEGVPACKARRASRIFMSTVSASTSSRKRERLTAICAPDAPRHAFSSGVPSIPSSVTATALAAQPRSLLSVSRSVASRGVPTIFAMVRRRAIKAQTSAGVVGASIFFIATQMLSVRFSNPWARREPHRDNARGEESMFMWSSEGGMIEDSTPMMTYRER